jgi:hypothetical protein
MHNFSSGVQKRPEKRLHFLPITFRLSGEKDCLYDPGTQKRYDCCNEKNCVRTVPFVLLNHQDTRNFMVKNAKGIATNNTNTCGESDRLLDTSYDRVGYQQEGALWKRISRAFGNAR